MSSNSNQTQATIVNPVECVLVTIRQAAQALQVSEKTVWNLMSAGKLQYVKVLGTRRIAVDELRRLAKYGSEAAVEIAKDSVLNANAADVENNVAS